MLNALRLSACVLGLTVFAPWLLAASPSTGSLPSLTSPKQHFGFNLGDDYQLATYTQTEAYFKKLASESDRLKLVDIGRTEEGRTQWMLVCSSPANLARLERWQNISRQLARAENLTETQARALAEEGKAVVWIDGGLHATETLGAHQLIESIWTFASRNDPETRRILDQVVILFTHANPDGQELISSWYMRRAEPTQRIVDKEPRLYQKYIGHDNNRDFMMMNMRESGNMARQLYIEWLPQIVYNHHQSGPPGTIVAGPPYRDPFNYVYDPLVVTGLDQIGAAMHSRWIASNMPGSTMKRGSVYSTWWNGGLRTTVYFHNMLGLLTETIGSPTPIEVPLVLERQLPDGDLPFPVAPQRWHFRRSIDYSLTANYAVLNYAARHRDELLFNIWRMGRNSIDRGSRDHWTATPKRIEALRAAARSTPRTPGAGSETAAAQEASRSDVIPSKYYASVFQKPEQRDPRGYLISRDQPDFGTAIKFLNTLIKSGLTLHRATADFTVGVKKYPAGSYVAKAAQAFRPYLLDAFEPQDHPNDFRYEGGPPIAPYDSAGWTLAYQMGVQFDRILEAFDGPFERIPYGQLQAFAPGRMDAAGAGWLISPHVNNGFILVNRLLQAGVAVSRLKAGVPGKPGFGPGAIFVPATAAARPILNRAVTELGLDAVGVSTPPAGEKAALAPVRIALWDQYGGSMPSGWTRWLLEQFEFPFEVVYPQKLDAGNLRAQFDVIIFPTGAIPRPKAQGSVTSPRVSAAMSKVPSVEETPEAYRSWLGRLSEEKTLPELKKFVAGGGSIVAIGSSTNLAFHFDVPVRNALTEVDREGKVRPLPREKYYIPGSLLTARVDPRAPLAWGLADSIDVYFDNSPAFVLSPEANAKNVRPVLWFATDQPLRSGWAWGQQYLAQTIQALEVPVGQGKLFLICPEVTFRAGTHGTFKLLFNALQLSTARAGGTP